MHRPISGALMLLCLVGCQNRKIVDDNPVLGPPPPRTTLDGSTAPTSEQTILQASAEVAGETALVDQLDERIVARINGQPVFAADVLRPFRPFIETNRNMIAQLPKAQHSMAKKQLSGEVGQLLERALPDYIDREVVLQSINKTLKQEQIDGIQGEIDNLFGERVDAVVAAIGLTSHAELEDLMIKPDAPRFENMMLAWREAMGTTPSTSLSESRDAFGKMALAAEFLRARAKEPLDVDRTALLEYYRSHSEDYDVPLELKWQQIVINHGDDKAAATQKMQAALRSIRSGKSFAEVAKANSDGATANEGGIRDWMEPGTLIDTEIEAKLFELPKGQFSDVFERPDRFEIVRVVDRRGGMRQSFESVQAAIKKTILNEMAKTARENALKEMREASDIVVLLNSKPPAEESLENLFGASR